MAEPAKILLTIPNFVTAGSGRALINIAARLDRTLFAPTICVAKGGGALTRELENLGIPLLEAPFTSPARPYLALPSRVRAAACFFKPYRFDLWHSFHYLDDYSEPLIARWAGARWLFTKKNMNWGRRAWQLRALLARGIAAQNTDMVRDFFGWPHRNKTGLIPRGVDTAKFRPGVEPSLGLRERLNLPSDRFVVASVAHLVAVKGHPTLIAALAETPGVDLVIAGQALEQPYVAALLCQVEELGLTGRVHFLGAIDDIAALHAEVDAFVLPTWARWRMEGCPVALLEAMACGKACIATAIPGARDLIVDGESGLLVEPENVAALASALRELRDDAIRRAALGQAARVRVEKEFTIEKEVARHEALYREVLKG
jgi:glycosyltransferase involved in cell wall biosynthesis